MLQSMKQRGKSNVSPLTSDMVLKDLEFSLLGFSFIFIQCFFTMPPFLSFGKDNIHSVELLVGSI